MPKLILEHSEYWIASYSEPYEGHGSTEHDIPQELIDNAELLYRSWRRAIREIYQHAGVPFEGLEEPKQD